MVDVRYLAIVETIIRQLEEGGGSWVEPWTREDPGHFMGGRWPLLPSGDQFGGEAALRLWAVSERVGYTRPTWLEAGQVRLHNGIVRERERGVTIVGVRLLDGGFADAGTALADSAAGRRHLRAYEFFNVDQIDGLPEELYRHYWEIRPINEDERNLHAEGFFRALSVDIQHEIDPDGGWASPRYLLGEGRILIPPWEVFNSGAEYYESLAHEAVHWADIDGSPAVPWSPEEHHRPRYELVAEIGAAFLCVDLGVSSVPRAAHADFIATWLRERRVDRLEIIGAMMHAERAVRWLHQEVPGYRFRPDIAYRGPAVDLGGGRLREEDVVAQRLIAARDARRFVVAAEGWRARSGVVDPAWHREALALLVEANRIDLETPGVRAAVAAEVIVSGAGGASAKVNADAYIEAFRHEAWRQLKLSVASSGLGWDRGSSSGRRM